MTEFEVEEVALLRARELRRKAALASRAASAPTSGSGGVDRILILLAERLERDASVLEQEGEGIDGPRGAASQRRAPPKPPDRGHWVAAPKTERGAEKGRVRRALNQHTLNESFAPKNVIGLPPLGLPCLSEITCSERVIRFLSPMVRRTGRQSRAGRQLRKACRSLAKQGGDLSAVRTT